MAICVYGIFVVLNTRDEMESIFLLTVSCQLRGVRGAHLRDDEDPKEHCTHKAGQRHEKSVTAVVLHVPLAVHVKLLMLLVPTCVPMVKVTAS